MRSARVRLWANRVNVTIEDGECLVARLTPRRRVALERLWPGHPSVFTVRGLDVAAAVAVCVGDWAKVERLVEGDWQAASDRTPDLWEELLSSTR
jgi:hypothetical protein